MAGGAAPEELFAAVAEEVPSTRIGAPAPAPFARSRRKRAVELRVVVAADIPVRDDARVLDA